MVFLEKKKENGYDYHLEDVFGTLDLESAKKLNPDELDGIVIVLLRQNLSAQTIEGEVEAPENIIKYKFVKAPVWSDDDDETCDDIPTSTSRLASVFIAIKDWPIVKWNINTLRWLRRFAVAFREAYRKTK